MLLIQTQNVVHITFENLAERNISEVAHAKDSARLNAAWDWMCQHRKTIADNTDIWDLRFHWDTQKALIFTQLQAGTYCLTRCKWSEKIVI